MTFVKYNEKWWEWNKDRMKLYNRRHGHLDIDENDPEWAKAETLEVESWHDLYENTRFSWMRAEISDHEIWIDPDGGIWGGECHEVDAEYILEDLYGMELNLMWCGDNLIKAGWIKAQTSFMTPMYEEEGMYRHMTIEQARVVSEYAEYHGIPRSFFDLDLYDA